VTGMTDTLDPILLNFFYAALGGLMTLVFMWLGCTLFNRIVCNFDIGEELAKGNQAVGMMVMGMFIGIGIGIGLVIGMGLN
jgi:uncharacterized membrane protein YjfL (UPF0719 family)